MASTITHMVEPISLSIGAIVAAIVAKASEQAADGAVDAGASGLRRLLAAVRERFANRHDEAVTGAVERVADAPDSPSRVETLAELIDERASADEALRRDLEALVEQARGEGVAVGSISQAAWGNQNVQAAGLVDSQVNVSYGDAPKPAPPE